MSRVCVQSFVQYLDTWSSLKSFREKEPGKDDPRIALLDKFLAAYKVNNPAEQQVKLSFELTLLMGTKP